MGAVIKIRLYLRHSVGIPWGSISIYLRFRVGRGLLEWNTGIYGNFVRRGAIPKVYCIYKTNVREDKMLFKIFELYYIAQIIYAKYVNLRKFP